MENQSRLATVCLLLIAAILLAASLAYTRSMMIPFVFALFLSYFVRPWVGFLRRKLHFPHWLAVFFGLVGFIGVIFLIGLVMRGSILHLVESITVYESKLAIWGEALSAWALGFGIPIDEAYLREKAAALPLFSYAQSAAGAVLSLLAHSLLVLVFLAFLVSGRGPVTPAAPDSTGIAAEIDQKIRSYIFTKVMINVITALLVWIVYVILDLEMALLFATLCFLLCFIPTLGSIIATLLPLPIAMLQFNDPLSIWLVLLIPMAIQQILGNFIEPKLLGKGLDLHPITILLSLMFWGLIWGLAGMFLAVPITAVLKIVLDRHPITHQFSEWLAGRGLRPNV
jgi:AI-2 transport protein TqsA